MLEQAGSIALGLVLFMVVCAVGFVVLALLPPPKRKPW